MKPSAAVERIILGAVRDTMALPNGANPVRTVTAMTPSKAGGFIADVTLFDGLGATVRFNRAANGAWSLEWLNIEGPEIAYANGQWFRLEGLADMPCAGSA